MQGYRVKESGTEGQMAHTCHSKGMDDHEFQDSLGYPDVRARGRQRLRQKRYSTGDRVEELGVGGGDRHCGRVTETVRTVRRNRNRGWSSNDRQRRRDPQQTEAMEVAGVSHCTAGAKGQGCCLG